MQFRGPDLLRVKGIINVEGMDRPMTIHGVQHVFHPPEVLERWPSEDRRTKVVFIARDLDHAELRSCFSALGLEAV
jgi:G3E family GTPase